MTHPALTDGDTEWGDHLTGYHHTPSREKGRTMRRPLIAGSTAVLLAVTGCTATSDDASPASPSPTVSPTAPDTAASDTARTTTPPTSRDNAASDSATTTPPTSVPAVSAVPASAAPDPEASVVEGTIVRFTSGDVEVDVTITADNPTTRDFLSMLPLTLTFEEFNGREKISYTPRELETAGSPGYDPEDGDLIYFASWGNLGFYYNADGIEYSDQTIELGTYDATAEQLTGLEGSGVTVEIVG